MHHNSPTSEGSPPRTSHDSGVISPFANVEADLSGNRSKSGKRLLWIGVVVSLLAIGAIGAFLLVGYLNDPYRTLEPFPISKYLDNYRSMAGSRFKAQLRVEADLGWKEGVGRLMLFSSADEPRPIAVMVPALVGKDIYFTKGQTYQTELEVKERGLIYANACRKN